MCKSKKIIIRVGIGILIIVIGLVILHKPNEKNVLKLNHELNSDLTKNIERKSYNTNIDIGNYLKETNWSYYENNNASIDMIVNYVLKDYPNLIDDNWQYNIHYYDDEQTSGIIQIRYTINKEIITNKAIICTIENNKIIMTSYINIDGKTNENEIIKKVNNFKNNYIQEKKKLKTNEEYIKETTEFSYNYNIDKLIYTYNLFYYETINGHKVINNSTVTEYFIN